MFFIPLMAKVSTHKFFVAAETFLKQSIFPSNISLFLAFHIFQHTNLGRASHALEMSGFLFNEP